MTGIPDVPLTAIHSSAKQTNFLHIKKITFDGRRLTPLGIVLVFLEIDDNTERDRN